VAATPVTSVPEVSARRLVDPAHAWYALRVRSNFERVTGQFLRQKGYEEFTPLYLCRRRWSDRVRELELPLFPGYVFCRFDASRRMPILTTPGVVSLVSFDNLPARVDEAEIAAIQAIVRSGRPVMPWPFLQVGQRVRVHNGPLRGVEGLLLHLKNQCRVVVSVTLLQRSVAVEIDSADVAPAP